MVNVSTSSVVRGRERWLLEFGGREEVRWKLVEEVEEGRNERREIGGRSSLEFGEIGEGEVFELVGEKGVLAGLFPVVLFEVEEEEEEGFVVLLLVEEEEEDE